MISLLRPWRFTAPGAAVVSPWLDMVVLGAAVGTVAQALMMASAGVTSAAVGLRLAPVPLVSGAVGARLWYAVSHRLPMRALRDAGFCVQGFIVASVATLALEALLVGLPVGAVLDATAPALFLGLAIGRIGCIRAGCCPGRHLPAERRARLWRALGVRALPTQLLECMVCAAIAVVTALVPVALRSPGSGAVMGGALLLHTASRQALLLPLRAARGDPGDNDRRVA